MSKHVGHQMNVVNLCVLGRVSDKKKKKNGSVQDV